MDLSENLNGSKVTCGICTGERKIPKIITAITADDTSEDNLREETEWENFSDQHVNAGEQAEDSHATAEDSEGENTK